MKHKTLSLRERVKSFKDYDSNPLSIIFGKIENIEIGPDEGFFPCKKITSLDELLNVSIDIPKDIIEMKNGKKYVEVGEFQEVDFIIRFLINPYKVLDQVEDASTYTQRITHIKVDNQKIILDYSFDGSIPKKLFARYLEKEVKFSNINSHMGGYKGEGIPVEKCKEVFNENKKFIYDTLSKINKCEVIVTCSHKEDEDKQITFYKKDNLEPILLKGWLREKFRFYTSTFADYRIRVVRKA